MDKQQVLREIKRTAAANGGAALGQNRFSQETGIRVSDWKGKFWVRWGDALREAGFGPHQKSGFPHATTFSRSLGSTKSQLAARIRDFCKGRDGYDDILALCAPILNAPAQPSGRAEANEEVFGSVYLAKSGRFYKIGSTNAVGRREYELGIQLPERIRLVHEIRTDDPNGIEAYWHGRFASKRKGGEWFALDAGDVQAFKRRKFM